MTSRIIWYFLTPPPPIVTLFCTKALILSSQKPWYPLLISLWCHLWTDPNQNYCWIKGYFKMSKLATRDDWNENKEKDVANRGESTVFFFCLFTSLSELGRMGEGRKKFFFSWKALITNNHSYKVPFTELQF